jgi:hypothetical protein
LELFRAVALAKQTSVVFAAWREHRYRNPIPCHDSCRRIMAEFVMDFSDK